MGRYHLTGIHTYDILRNPSYWQSFQYISASVPNRHLFIKDGDNDISNNCEQSDFVRKILNLSFLPPDTLRQMWTSGFKLKKTNNNDLLPKEIKVAPKKLPGGGKNAKEIGGNVGDGAGGGGKVTF